MIKGVQCQPPSGGCVLKRAANNAPEKVVNQPPSGGCVLKLKTVDLETRLSTASRLQAAVC